MKGPENTANIFVRVLFSILIFHAFFFIFLSIDLQHGQVLASPGKEDKCSVEALSSCPGDLSLDVCQHGSGETSTTVDSSAKHLQSFRANSAFMFSMITNSLWLDSTLKVFSNQNNSREGAKVSEGKYAESMWFRSNQD